MDEARHAGRQASRCSCGASLPDAARFCPVCGAAQPGPGARAPVEERRHVTVMFCDLAGSTSISQRFDAEDYGDLLKTYHDACQAGVREFGGHVHSYLGDGVLGYFGYPTAHEDSAARAVRAGLRILGTLAALRQEKGPWSELLNARIGIHSGEVLISEIGDGGRSEATAIGRTPNIAARLQASADANTVVCSGATRGLLGQRVRVQRLPQMPLKGIDVPVDRFVVTEVREPEADEMRRRAEVSTVGREPEQSALAAAWAQAQAGRGRAVLLGGEAGMGKSALASELCRGLAPTVRLFEVLCSAYDINRPLRPVVRALSRELGFDALDLAGRQQRLAGGVTGVAPVDDSLRRLLAPVDATAAAAPQEAESARRDTLEGIVELVRLQAAQQPVCLLVEDAHWADASTLELIELLLPRLEALPCLLLVTARPQFQPPWARQRAVTRIALGPLARGACTTLVESAIPGGLPHDVMQRVLDRADGNPLYLDALARSIGDQLHQREAGKLESLEVPGSLRDLLSSRLDGVGAAREIAQRAAVLGRHFDIDLLAALSGEDVAAVRRHVARLVQAQIVVPDPRAGPEHFDFRHALIRDAAYESLPKRQRRDFHARAAAILQARTADLERRHPERLAVHCAGAGEAVRGATLYLAAGVSAGQAAAYREAAGHFRCGIQALHEKAEPGHEALELTLHIRLGNALMAADGYAAAENRAIWARAEELARLTGDREELSSALNGTVTQDVVGGKSAAAQPRIAEILAIAGEDGSRVAALRGHCSAAMLCMLREELADGFAHAQRAVAAYRPGDYRLVTYGMGTDQGVASVGIAQNIALRLGRLAEAVAFGERGLEWAHATGSGLSLAFARCMNAWARLSLGDAGDAAAAAEHTVQISSRLRFPYWEGFGRLLLGAAQAELGRPAAALEQVQAGLTLLTAAGNPGGASVAMYYLGCVQLAAGIVPAAQVSLKLALDNAAATGETYFNGAIWRAQARALYRSGQPARAGELLTQAQLRARQTGDRMGEFLARADLAAALAETGQGEQAVAYLEELPALLPEAVARPSFARVWKLRDALIPITGGSP